MADWRFWRRGGVTSPTPAATEAAGAGQPGDTPTPVTDGLQHWTSRRDGARLLWLYLHRADGQGNALARAVIQELATALDRVRADKPRGLIIASAEPRGFSAGADLHDFQGLTDPDAAHALVLDGQAVVTKLARLGLPTVAMIHGFCLGGGLELALACRMRVATTEARLGFPEVGLGLHPGYGGTARLTRLLPAHHALPLILEGRRLTGEQARAQGLVDAAVPERHLVTAAVALATGATRPRRSPRLRRLVLNQPGVRHVAAYYMRKTTVGRVRGDHYPAPLALIDVWRRKGGTRRGMLRAEANSAARLIVGDTAQNLMRGFFLRERLKDFGRQASFSARHVHVCGAGTMGGAIAAWCALRGYTVTLQDVSLAATAPAVRRAHSLFVSRLRTDHGVTAAMDRLIPDVGGDGLRRADVVIEAIPERSAAKQELYARLEPAMPEHALLATNTSSIRLEELADGLARPERLVGLHFFNPVAKMPLVEVIAGTSTSQASADAAAAFTATLDKLPLPVASHPGFFVNRCLTAYVLEAIAVLAEGSYSRDQVDEAALAFGMPMGPLHLADRIGLDICAAMGATVTAAYGGTVPQRLHDLVADGKTGLKAGAGFYSYKGGAAQVTRQELTQARSDMGALTALEDRLILPMVNSVVAARREAVVADDDLADAGMILGTGFAPFRGGPLAYARKRGWAHCREKLSELAATHGERLTPDPGWQGREPGGDAPD